MTLPIIERIRLMLQDLAPGAVFECDQARMLNVKVDTMPRFETGLNGEVIKDSNGNPVSTTFIYIEEPLQGYYDIPYRGHQRQRLPLMIYFCKFEPMGNDAYKGDTPFSTESKTTSRLILRDELERTIVRPFLLRLKTSQLGMLYPEMMNTVRIVYPSARFDANEVSTSWPLHRTERFTLTARNIAGVSSYSLLQINIGNTKSNPFEVSYTTLRTILGDMTLWYNPVCIVKARKGTTIFTPAPEAFKQYPFNTPTIVG